MRVKISIMVFLLIFIYLPHALATVSQDKVNSAVNQLIGQSKLTFTDFKHLAGAIAPSTLYVISVNTDSQHYPVAAINLPDGIVKVRKEIKGSQQTKETIMDRYNNILIQYFVKFVEDKSGELYLVIVDNKGESASEHNNSTFPVIPVTAASTVAVVISGVIWFYTKKPRLKPEITAKRTNVTSKPELVPLIDRRLLPMSPPILTRLIDKYYTVEELEGEEFRADVDYYLNWLNRMFDNYIAPRQDELSFLVASLGILMQEMGNVAREHRESLDLLTNKDSQVKTQFQALRGELKTLRPNGFLSKASRINNIKLMNRSYDQAKSLLIKIENTINESYRLKNNLRSNGIFFSDHGSISRDLLKDELRHYFDTIADTFASFTSHYDSRQEHIHNDLFKLIQLVKDKDSKLSGIADYVQTTHQKISEFEQHLLNVSNSGLTGEWLTQLSEIKHSFQLFEKEEREQVNELKQLLHVMQGTDERLNNRLDGNAQAAEEALKTLSVNVQTMDNQVNAIQKHMEQVMALLNKYHDLALESRNDVDLVKGDLKKMVIRHLQDCNKQLRICMYDMNDQDLLRELKNLSMSKGVGIKIIIDRDKSKARRNRYKDYFKENPRIEIRENSLVEQYHQPQKMHRKDIVVDDRVVLTGSMNFTWSGTSFNHETLIVLKNGFKADEFIDEFEKLWHQCDSVTL